MSLKARDILETCLYATNLDAAARWYAEVMGLVEFSRQQGRHVFFRCGGRCLFLFNPESTRGAASGGITVPTHGAFGAGHVCFAVRENELPLWRERFAALNVAIERFVDWPNGARSIYVRDPAGNSVEVAAPALWNIDESECLPPEGR